MSERYAIYYAPDAQSDLWALASEWLGRDAATGETVPQAVLEGVIPDIFAANTTSPRRYGFHSTLKAPMRLAEGVGVNQVLAMAEQFAKTHQPASIGTLEVQSLDGFLAIVPSAQSEALLKLVSNVVTFFEPARAPLSQADRDRRIANGLNAREIELLDKYGYPYVMEAFRMHLTLSNRVQGELLTTLKETARNWFAPVLSGCEWKLDRIAVYKEAESGAPFIRVADFPLLGSKI